MNNRRLNGNPLVMESVGFPVLMQPLVVFFGDGLSEDEFFDDAKRLERLEHGIARLRERVPEIEILGTYDSSCSAGILGTPDTLRRAKAFLETSGLGLCEENSEYLPVE